MMPEAVHKMHVAHPAQTEPTREQCPEKTNTRLFLQRKSTVREKITLRRVSRAYAFQKEGEGAATKRIEAPTPFLATHLTRGGVAFSHSLGVQRRGWGRGKGLAGGKRGQRGCRWHRSHAEHRCHGGRVGGDDLSRTT